MSAAKKVASEKAPPLPARQAEVLKTLSDAQSRSKKFGGASPADIALLTGIASSSQVCNVLRALVAKKLVVKLDTGKYKKA